uniref:hypothetical protein n=1 Tax=Methylobacterium sp. B34 TaxID=95563 RepID=UPI0005B2B9BB
FARLASGTLLSALLGLAAGGALAEDAVAPRMAATVPAGRGLAPDPEKDTVTLQSSRAAAPSVGLPDLPSHDGSSEGAVRVGQGLRPDGTEVMPSEVSRPWLIRQ